MIEMKKKSEDDKWMSCMYDGEGVVVVSFN